MSFSPPLIAHQALAATRDIPRYAPGMVRGTLLLLLVAATAGATPARVNPPSSIASMGDSITQAANVDPEFLGGTNPDFSWTTGANQQTKAATIQSHYRRLLAIHPPIAGNNRIAAVSGARMVDLASQVNTLLAAPSEPDYITLLLGANDACTSSEGTMTSVTAFRGQLQEAMTRLTSEYRDARIFVASIPDAWQLWNLLHTSATARWTWSSFSICQSLLQNPTSTAVADVERRARVRQRIRDFNRQLEEVCAQHLRCRFDRGVVFTTPFAVEDVSSVDAFHPSVAGQRKLAAYTWAATFDFTDTTPPVTQATQNTFPSGNAEVVLTATDAAGVRGIEYRRDGALAWTTYTAPLLVTPTTFLEFRAVDVNGNVEAARRFVFTDPGSQGPTPDGGTEGPSVPTTDRAPGCSCQASLGPAWAALLALVLLCRRRPSKSGADPR